MKNHDQLHVIKTSGTDHCGNSGYIHQGFPHGWTYTIELGASKASWKICNNWTRYFFWSITGAFRRGWLRLLTNSGVRGQAWFKFIRADQCLQSSLHSRVVPQNPKVLVQACSEDQPHAGIIGDEEPKNGYPICGSMLSHTVSLQGSNKLTSHVTILIMLHVLHGKAELRFSQHIKECYAMKPWRQTSCGQPNASHAGRKDKGNTFKHIYALYPTKW